MEMMHVDMRLRSRPEFCIPKGPSFKRARTIRTNFLGTQIEFRAPKHRPAKRLKGDPLLPKKIYTPDTVFFESNFSPRFVVADLWEHLTLFVHEWGFNGPWFTGNLASLAMYFSIYQLKEPTAAPYKNNPSFFHPRVFEQVVGDFLTNKYSVRQDEGQAEWMAPINWEPLTSLPTVAVRLQVCRDERVTTSGYKEYVFFPISDGQLGVMLFAPRQRVPESYTQAEQDAIVSRKNIIALTDNIVDSLKLELSPEAAAAQVKALEGLEDTSLVKTFAPMQWSQGQSESRQVSQDAAATFDIPDGVLFDGKAK